MIRVREVRLIGPNGDQLGILPIDRALELAEQNDMDLVEVAPQARPPVCKVMDYGRYKYSLAKKAQEAKKKQAVIHVKEVKVRPKTEEHDFQVKLKKVRDFLNAGNKVKVTVMFRGREVTIPEKGLSQLKRMLEELGDDVKVESQPKMEGRSMFMMLSSLAPKK
ncbi:MAG: translation initiation factor IF-3 [Deltaproteobacteria bacterium]|nr:MAG: translation initiation factor IF-3 [Deltaproteobacteria bacterium]